MFTVARVSSWLLVIVSVLALLVQAAPVEETNAQRFARGLPPLTPANLRRTSGTETADQHRPSSHPPTTYTGRLQVRTATGNVLGFVRNWGGAAPISGISFGDGDLRVSISTNNPAAPFDIVATNAKFANPHYIGAEGRGPLNRGSARVVGFNNVGKTRAGSPPFSGHESAIWTMNPQTKALRAHFVNPDGSTPRTTLAYDARANALFFVGDIDAYNDEFDYYPASAVTLYLVN